MAYYIDKYIQYIGGIVYEVGFQFAITAGTKAHNDSGNAAGS
jgi:hypothetical protein